MSQEMRVQKYITSIKSMFLDGIRPATAEQYTVQEYMIPMGDGIRLRTIVYKPEGVGPFPTLMTRTPYPGFDIMLGASGEEYAKRGYAYVIQFCRGTVGSEGEWVPNENERRDGIDTVHWLAELDWVKSIGVHGVSYLSLTGWIIADQLPEKVKALYLCHYSVDRFRSAYKDGLFRHDVLTGWTLGNIGMQMEMKDFYDFYLKSSAYRPHIRVDEALWGKQVDWYREWITNTDEASEYWNTGTWKTLREIPEKIKVPVCVVAGWYDHHLEGTLLGYEKLKPEIKAKSKLVIGGWNHDFEPCVPAHKPQNANINTVKLMFDWFDSILMEEKTPDPVISAYQIGEDEWKNYRSWPLPMDNMLEYQLTDSLNLKDSTFQLSKHEMADEGKIQFVYNPENPVYTRGGETTFVSYKQRGSVLQDQPGSREEVISLLSEELTNPIRISGKINVKLHVGSSAEDTCFTAKVIEVLPNGEAYNIRSGITTLAYRNSAPVRREYQPEDIVEINIEMLPVAWCLKPGSRLRIDLSSSSFPEYAVHSNYAGIWSLQEHTKAARQTIYCGGRYRSQIQIPVVTRGEI